MAAAAGDQYPAGCSNIKEINETGKQPKKYVGALIQIDLPPPPRDICDIFDPVMKNDLRIAVFTTIFCWFLLGILPVVIGLIGIHYALKARNCKDPDEKLRYSLISKNISWIGMILFTSVLTAATVILATCGVL